MKKILLCSLATLALAHATNGAEYVAPFDVNYVVSNHVASGSAGSLANRASGIWLGNLRGLGTSRDIIVANSADNTVSVRLANDNGTFGPLVTYGVGLAPMGVRSGNLNGDQFEDIVVANSGTNTVSVLYNLGSGFSFMSASNFVVGATGTPGPIAVTINDVNGDSAQDLLVVNAIENSVSVLLRSNLNFILSTNYPVGTNPHSIQVADFNKDGRSDFIVANRNDGTLTILYKQTNGTFASPQTITLFAGGDPQPVHALPADFNGDTWLDIACANYNSNTVSVLLGSSNGTYTVSTNYAVGTNPRSMAIRDFNDDGIVDIAVANEGSGTVSVLLNLGAAFVGGYTTTVGSSPAAIAGSHLNAGPLDDIAVANNGDNTVSVLLYDFPLPYATTVSVLEDVTNFITLTSLVLPGRTATYTLLSSPTSGVLSGTAPNLTYVPTNNFYGTDSFTFYINDGVTDSEIATITINVTAVNDAPSFTLNTNSVTLQRYGALNTYSNIVATSSRGPANESAQTLSFIVTTTNTSMFSTQPALSASGVLTFRPSPSANGTATLSIRIRDNGGTLHGGINESPTQSFTVVLPANPYPAIQGGYDGLFYESTGVTHESSGYCLFNVNSSGAFSGRVIIGKIYSLSGYFNTSGHSVLTVSRGTNGPPLTLDLDIDLTAGATEQITGTVSDGTWTADLLADRGFFHSTTNPAPQAGKYTMLFPGSINPATSPGGSGYATVSVSTGGAILLSGTLADGKTFSQTSKLSKNREWPLYALVYTGKGSVLSWITFTNEFNTSFKGNLSWIKTGAAGGTHYPLGFTNEVFPAGSTYVPPAPGTRILDMTNGITSLGNGGNLPAPLINNIFLKTNNWITILGGQASNLVVTLNTNLGYVIGTFKHPVSGVTTSIKGIVFQQQTTAGGYFLGSSQSGAFLLQQN